MIDFGRGFPAKIHSNPAAVGPKNRHVLHKSFNILSFVNEVVAHREKKISRQDTSLAEKARRQRCDNLVTSSRIASRGLTRQSVAILSVSETAAADHARVETHWIHLVVQ
jgi:hypothetical protein